MQDDLCLFGLLHGKLTRAAHQGLQAAFCLYVLTVISGVLEEEFRQPSQRFLPCLGDGVQP